MIYPSGDGPAPEDQMPAAVLEDYEEARSVAGLSPRSAAALLRLALEKLCSHLGYNEGNLSKSIQALVAKEQLPPVMDKMLTNAWLIGNNAAHDDATISVTDDPLTVALMFELINIIVQRTIVLPTRINATNNALSAAKAETSKTSGGQQT